MDDSWFDQFTQSLEMHGSRRAVVTALGSLMTLPALTVLEADARKKKKKKKCARKCPNGCCTGKTGKCIQPDQQSSAQCGTGGEICRSSGCVGTCPNCRCSDSAPCRIGECCGGDGTCGACTVFVTSTSHTGNLGGLAGADTICQTLANTAGLPGTYRAWLSDSSASPNTRFIRATVPYRLTDGTVIADSYSDLAGNSLGPRYVINNLETGAEVGSGPNTVWNYTDYQGNAGGPGTNNHCGDWSSAASDAWGTVGMLTTSSAWTDYSVQSCVAQARLYCFQQR